MRPYRLDSAKDRLTKTREVISRLGKTMNINISPGYHRLRLEELELTADHLAMVEEEKERIRAERERQRDEQQAQREFEREKARLSKEQAHWQTAMRKWAESGDEAKTTAAQAKLDELDEAIRGVEEREANIRTGWVYVISNVGSFGEGVVKIGLTRRLDPLERVRELGDASVPFRFDVHAKIFDADAVTLETRLHQHLADRRVNRVNLRREFFYATPGEILEILEEMGLRDNLVDYVQEPEAQEWRSSQQLAGSGSRHGLLPAAAQ
jgi:soluble cytochrome b562